MCPDISYATYKGEHGLHAFSEEQATHNLLVHTSDTDFKEYLPPSSLERRGAIAPASHGERRRTYNRTEGYVEDRVLDERREWHSAQADGMRGLAATLKYFIAEQLKRAAEKLIEDNV